MQDDPNITTDYVCNCLNVLGERFAMIVDAEWTHHDNKRMTRSLKEAKLRFGQATVEAIDYELDVADRTCTSRGGELSEWVGQFEAASEIDMVERRFVALVHKRTKYRCKCGGCIQTAPAPPKLMPGGRYSIDIAVGKYANRWNARPKRWSTRDW